MRLRDKLYFKKLKLLFVSGVQKGKIVPFDDEYYQELNQTIFTYCPVGLDIQYLKPKVRPGKCYDRSLKMFMAMKDSFLVRGSLEYFRLKGDHDVENHGWVERDGYVSDPTFLHRFEKDYYYKMFKVTGVHKCTHEEYCELSEQNKELYQKVKSTTREKMRTDLFCRTELLAVVPLLQGIAEHNEAFQKEFNIYLKEINYDEEQISEELTSELQKLMKVK